jgi:hypothetical protein
MGVYKNKFFYTNNDGRYSIRLDPLSSGFEYIKVSVNSNLWRYGVCFADQNYTFYHFQVYTLGKTTKNIQLQPRKPVIIVAKPNPIVFNSPAQLIELKIRENTPTANHSYTFNIDSVQVLVGTNLRHEVSVKYSRNSKTKTIYQYFQFNCDSLSKIKIIY